MIDTIGMAVVTLLAVLVYWAHVRAQVDMFRQDMFDVRDQLFELAHEGQECTFDDPRYRELRDRINHRIRWAHVVSSWMLVPFALHRGVAALRIEVVAAAEEVPPPYPPRMADLAREVKRLNGLYYLVRAPLLMGVLMVLALPAVLRKRAQTTAAVARSQISATPPSRGRRPRRRLRDATSPVFDRLAGQAFRATCPPAP